MSQQQRRPMPTFSLMSAMSPPSRPHWNTAPLKTSPGQGPEKKESWEDLQRRLADRGILIGGPKSEARSAPQKPAAAAAAAASAAAATTSLKDTLSMCASPSSGGNESCGPLSSLLSSLANDKSALSREQPTAASSGVADGSPSLAGVLAEAAKIHLGGSEVSKERPSVSFSDTTRCYPVTHLSDMSDEDVADVWCTDVDARRFQDDIFRTIMAERRGTLEKEGGERRGIEHLLILSHARKRKEMMTAAVRAVLQEQEYMRASSGNIDESVLRSTSEAHTKWAREVAIESGAADAAFVRSHVRATDKVSQLSSVTKSVLSRLKNHPQLGPHKECHPPH